MNRTAGAPAGGLFLVPPPRHNAAMLTRRAALVAAAAALAPRAHAQPASLDWTTLRPGLDHARARLDATIGDRWLHILRISPARFRFTLLTGEAAGKSPRSAARWAREHDLVAATNAGMFHPNGLPVGFAKSQGRVIQPTITRDRCVFVFNQTRARIIDRACETFDAESQPNALQSIRMISCDGRNVWTQQPRRWSIACLAQDAEGRILFLHSRSPHSVHDFITAIQALPLSIARCMYLEGGPEATFYVNAGDAEIERYGSFETAFNENDDNGFPWPLPNILGVVAR